MFKRMKDGGGVFEVVDVGGDSEHEDEVGEAGIGEVWRGGVTGVIG